MPPDYSRQNLRGCSFKGQNLSGADFSGADIRGADFTHALLIGANFRGAKAGLQRRWVVGLVAFSWLIAGLSGFFSILIGALASSVLDRTNTENFISAIVLLITLAIFFIVTFRKGLAAVAFAIAFDIAFAIAFAIAGAVAVAVAGARAVAVAVALTLASTYIGWRGWAKDEKYALVRSFAVAFAATGGTSFRSADLTDANFSGARLKSTNFRGAIVTRTYWHKTKMLDRVRPGRTYLQNPQVQQVLVTGYGQDKNFDRQDLRGVNFTGATLADASFIGADLSGANLQDANLSRAILVQTQLDETDLTGATLTGAYIEDWGITSHTKLDGVSCEYVFMRQPTKKDPNPRRKPDNWEEKFEDGDFADFIKPIVDTLDLYHNQDVDPRAIAISFKQLAEKNPEAELEIVGMEKRGQDKFLLRAKTAVRADKSELSAEYFKIYNQLKALAEQEVKALIAEKDSRIFDLQKMITTTLQRPSFYSSTQIQEVGNMVSNPGGFSVGGSVGGDVNNVQGNNNRTVQGDNNQAVLGDSNQVRQQNQVGVDPETSLTKDEVVKLLAELETLIKGAELPTDTKEEITEDLSATKKATDKEEPNKKRALERLTSAAETLEKASKTVDAGQSLWSKAKPLIIKVAGWLGAAAGSHLLGL